MERLPTIAEAQELIRQGQLTPVELVEHCLARIEQFDERIQAWVHVDAAGARRQAEEQTRLAREGRAEGTLFGIPIGIKDIIDVAGMKTQCGSPLLAENVAAEDAPVVAALRRQGAIILGKTVTTQFACFDPAPTRNPWNLDHSPGGSSSGSAAAVAMEMCLAALGTQTGGSILRPAAYCGVVGFKPTFGSLDMRGIQPVSRRLDHVGPIARSVADAEAVWTAVRASQSIADASPNSEHERADRWSEFGAVGVPRSWFEPECLPTVMKAFDKTGVEPLIHICHDIDFDIPLAQVLRAHRAIMAHDIAGELWSAYQQDQTAFERGLASLLEEGHRVESEELEAALAIQTSLRAELNDCAFLDAFLLPTTITAAPPLPARSTGDPRLNSPFSLTGHPAITLPHGLCDGLPVGLQLVGGLNEDAHLLRLAIWLESELPWRADRPQPPMLGA